jgi:Calcineurin-like phosphoesterase
VRVTHSVTAALVVDDDPADLPPELAAPDQVIVAGDWHGNREWAAAIVRQLPLLLEHERPRLILQAGDFGFRPSPASWMLRGLDRDLEQAGAELWWIDGNHDDHDALATIAAARRNLPPPYYITDNIAWLPRGHRWTWHGRTWLAAGGAVSVDRAGPPCLRCAARGCDYCRWEGRFPRIQGTDWWAEEEITDDQAQGIIDDGPADVLLSHDCPVGVVHAFPDRPSWWDPADIARAEEHQGRLQRIVDAVQPSQIVHGHLHMGYQRRADFGYGPVDVTGLNCDGEPYNWLLLDTRTMTWDVPAAASHVRERRC